MTNQVPSNSAPARLQLISCRGVASKVSLPLDRRAVALNEVGDLSAVPVPDETLFALQQCEVDPVAESGGTQWWLHNRGCRLHCTVNAQRINAGDALPLHDGDLIEIGLVQIRYQTGECVSQPAIQADTASLASSLPESFAASNPQSIGGPAFQLTDLDRLAAQPARQPPSQHTPESPFRDILDAVGSGKTPISRRHVASSAMQLEATTLRDAASVGGAGFAGVMDELHRQYLRLMQNPSDPQMAGRWDVREASIEPQAPGFDALMRQTQHRDLYDILGHGVAIDPILDRLKTLSGHDVLQAPAPVDVLRLFAPATHHSAEVELPALTRRDHHSITADSAMRLDGDVQATLFDPSSGSKPRA